MARHCRFYRDFSRSFLAIVTLTAVIVFTSLGMVAQTSTTTGTAVFATPNPATFVVAPALSLVGTPSSVAAGDLRGSGHLDLVVANSSSGKISVFLGKGNGQFAAPVSYGVGKQPVSVLLADVNGDGKLDVVVSNELDGTISVLPGNGDGTLQRSVTYTTISDPTYVAVGDFNGDGKPDLAVAGRMSGSVAIHLNNGNGGFSAITPYQIGKSVNSLAVADYNGDGRADVATANSDGTISVLFGRGDGTFGSMSSIQVGSTSLSSIASGDFNHDGKADLAVAEAGAKQVSVLFGNGDGTFQSGQPLAVGTNPSSILSGDVNGDGVADLIVTNQAANTFSVLLSNGDGTFKSSVDFVSGKSPVAVAVGDFNGDGKLDLAIANSLDKSVSVPLGNGDGTFKAARVYSAELQRKAVAVGDLDGDGKLDLVVTNYCGTDATCSGKGTASIFLANGDGSYRSAGSYSLGVGPLAVALADVNGDKKPDLIAANRGDSTYTVLLGNGDGTFQSAITYPLASSPSSLSVGDFNGDGKADLAITSDCGSSQCSQQGQVSVLLGNGDATFQTAATVAVGFSPVSIAVGDVNGDSKPDLIVANSCGQDATCKSKGSATVLIGDGKGNFQLLSNIGLGMSPSSVALGDLSGRKILDLVSAHSGDNKIAVLRGNGDGTFASPATYSVGTAPSSLVIADFNGDGKPDVAVANLKDSTVSLLLGNGDGTLQNAAVYPTSVGPEALAAVGSQTSTAADLVATNGNTGSSPMGSNITVLSNLASPNVGTVVSTTTIAYTAPGTSPVTYGTSLTFVATVAGNTTNGTPSGGQVDFTANGTAFDPACTNVTPTAGVSPTTVANCTSTLLPAGTYPSTLTAGIVAAYNGDNTYAASQGFVGSALTVSQATPTVSVASSSTGNTSVYGTAVNFTATVTGVSGAATPTGTVNFVDTSNSNASVCSSVTVTAGQAVCINIANLTGGGHVIQANYLGDPNYGTANGTVTQTVHPAATTMSMSTVPPSPTNVNSSVTITATITPSTSGGLPPTTSVRFTSNGTTISDCTNPATLTPTGAGNSASATCITHLLVAPSDVLIATYNGDTNYTSSTATVIQTVNATSTTLTLSSPGPSTVNQPVTFTATVAPVTSGPINPNGAVTFTQGTTVLCTGVALTSGRATCTYAFPTAAGSPFTVAASYTSSDVNFGNSSGNVSQAVGATGTSTSVSSSAPTGSTVNQSVTFTATVTPNVTGTTQPAGSVTFTQGTTVLCTGVALTSGRATCTYPFPTAAGSPFTVTASYTSSDVNFGNSSGNVSQTVGSTGTSTSVSSSAATGSTVNQSVTFTATVTPNVTGTTQPAGSVTFMQGTTVLCSGVVLTGGRATCSYAFPTAAGSPFTVTASYTSSDVNFSNSSGTFAQIVGTTGTSTTVSSSLPSGSTVNQSVTFTATVAPSVTGTTLPTGTVTFTQGSTILCSAAALNSTTGKATCNYAFPTDTGSPFTVTATYSGDANFSTSNGSTSQTVNATPTTTVLASSLPVSAEVNQTVTFTATVTANVPGTTLPTGTVTFTQGSTTLCSAAALNPTTGKATCNYAFPTDTGSPFTVKATYSGDSNFTGSLITLPQNVITATTQTALTFTPGQSSVNQPVTLTATVTPAFAGATKPAGTITFTYNSVAVPECPSPIALPTSGVISCKTYSLPGGSDAVAAVYASADTNFSASSDSKSFSVLSTSTTTTLTSNPATSVSGQPVTLTATVVPLISGPPFSPQGSVTFTSSGSAIPECPTPVSINSAGIATCTSVSLASGLQYTLSAKYSSADANFSGSAGTTPQTVQDFAITASPTAPVPVTQGLTNTTNLFTTQQQAIAVTVTPLYTYSGTVLLNTPICLVQPAAGQVTNATTLPTCTVSTTSLSLAGGAAMASVTIGANASSPVGLYTVTVTATDKNIGLKHSTSFSVDVVNNTAAINVLPGNAGTTTASFTGPIGQNVTLNFSSASCTTVTGSGLGVSIPAGGVPLATSNLGMSCAITPGSITLNGSSTAGGTQSITVSVGTNGTVTTGRLVHSPGIFAALWLGFPGIVLAGSLRSRRSRRELLQILGILLVLVALLQGIGCGGGFTRQPTVSGTPTGAYQVLVQTTGSDGATYSAVVPVNVGH